MTYERMLKEIKKPNQRVAQRVLQCLVVAIRPLCVDELAEVLEVDFDDADEIPRMKPDWLREDPERALLSTCPSLISIVEAPVDFCFPRAQIVQFSHSSVKEFLTSSRLATASGEVSNYHIDSEPAHTTLGQACLSVLLQVQDNNGGKAGMRHPLARYAAEYWMAHAQFGKVWSRLRKGIEYLFDANKPHFRAWIRVYNIDSLHLPEDSTFYQFALYLKSPAAPLYYAALYGLYDLVEYLIAKNPQDVNADGGRYVRPLVAALAGEHFQTADLLRHNGADLEFRGRDGSSPLHGAAYSGNREVVRKLIEYDPANINVRDPSGWTPLFSASAGKYFKDGSALRLLLEHGADVNSRDQHHDTPLHRATGYEALEVVRLLLEFGADLEAKNRFGETALQLARRIGLEAVWREQGIRLVKLLREHGAK